MRNVKAAIGLCLFTFFAPFALFAEEDPTLRKNVIVIFDDSGSMNGMGRSKLVRAKQAMRVFISHLPDEYDLGIYALNKRNIFPLQPLTPKNRPVAIDRIMKLRADGGTPLALSIEKTTAMLVEKKKQQAGYGFYTLVIATDGEANRMQQMFEAVDKAIARGITIKTIGIDIKRHGLRRVTDFTEASSTDQMVAAMKRAVKAEVVLGSRFVPQDF